MHTSSKAVDSTDSVTWLRNMTTKSKHDNYQQNKSTLTNIVNNEQIDALVYNKWFSVLEQDAKRISVGDVHACKAFHYTIIKINDKSDYGFTIVHFTKTGPMPA